MILRPSTCEQLQIPDSKGELLASINILHLLNRAPLRDDSLNDSFIVIDFH